MRVLMFGWEFPPHISGGLGTACYGLTKGLSEIDDVEVTFVVPKAFGDEDQTAMQLIGANTVPVSQKEIRFHENKNAGTTAGWEVPAWMFFELLFLFLNHGNLVDQNGFARVPAFPWAPNQAL